MRKAANYFTERGISKIGMSMVKAKLVVLT